MKVECQEDGSVWFACPGCKDFHRIVREGTAGAGPRWAFDGNMEKPTISPSIRCRSRNKDGPTVCHSFVRAGNIEFLNDCTHALAGQAVELPEFSWVAAFEDD